MEENCSIIEMFKKQLQEDKMSENYDLPEGIDEKQFTEEMKERYKEALDKMRAESDNANSYSFSFSGEKDEIPSFEDSIKHFNDTYTKVNESDLDTTNNTTLSEVNVMVKHAYCPRCGKEIISSFPVMFNPYTNEKIARYDCACGAKMNLEYSYPRLVLVTKDTNEVIKAFND